MNRDHLVSGLNLLGRRELIEQAAFHEAGHAAAIYLRNRYYDLPQINFQISLLEVKPAHPVNISPVGFGKTECHAKLEGGLLLENKLLNDKGWGSQAVVAFQQACEADVVNLLAGPLAEAKHVALRDGECINPYLINYDALKNYGGKLDQDKSEEYLDGFKWSPLRKAEKLKELHAASFNFINQSQHWQAITRLAKYILDSEKEIIAYEDAVAVLEAAIGTSY